MLRAFNLGEKTFSSLSVRNYRLFFFGQAVSLCGTWMQSISQAWLVLKLTNSGTQLGLVTAAQFLPVLLLAPIAGVLVDRFSKRKILFFTQTSFMILALTLGILVATDGIKLWMVYVLASCLGLVTAIDNPTRQTFITEMVGEDQLKNAITLNSVQFNLARLIGPALAGILIASVSLALCFFANAASYIAVIIGLLLMDETKLFPARRVERLRGQLSAGFRYLKSSKVLVNTLVMLGIIGTLAYEFQVSLPLIAKFTFNGDARAYASLTSAMGLGAVIGGLIAASRKRVTTNLLLGTAAIFGITLLMASLAPSLPIAIICMVLVGIFSINFTTLGNVTLQTETIPEMRGRVMAFWTVAFLGSTPIGGPIVGWVGENLGARWSIGIGGIATLFAALVGWLTLRKIDKEVSDTVLEIAEQTAEEDPRVA